MLFFFCQMSSVGQDHIVRFSCCQGDTPEEAAGLFDAEIRDNAKRHGYLSKNGIPQIDMLLLATDKNGFVCSSKASNYVEFTRNLMVRMETPNAFGRFNTARLPHFSLNRTIIDQAKNLFFIFPENFTS